MFGKGRKHHMTANEKFIMDRGRKAGTVPMKKDSVGELPKTAQGTHSGRKTLGALGKVKT